MPLSFPRLSTRLGNRIEQRVSALLNANGTITFPGSAFQGISPFLADTSDTIDGGGGVNVVVYRTNYANYTILPQEMDRCS